MVEVLVGYLATLIVHSDGCALPDQARKAYDLLQGPKALHWTDGLHFDFYDGAKCRKRRMSSPVILAAISPDQMPAATMESDAMTPVVATQVNVAKLHVAATLCVRIGAECGYAKSGCDNCLSPPGKSVWRL